MRINNTYLSGVMVSWVEGPPLQTRAARRAARPGQASLEVSSHILSSELLHWTSLAGKEPEIRSELLKTVLERIAQRSYFTAVSAAQTAEAILQAEE